jgi:DNA-binding IclR family transcriptional regulator
LPRTTAHRTAQQMLQLGWLRKYEGRYSIGLRLLELAGLALMRVWLREAALPFLQDLYEATHETVHLMVLEETQVFRPGQDVRPGHCRRHRMVLAS